MAVTMQTRRDDSADWATANPVLALGEIGIETDTDKAKYGDGFTAWNDLNYWIDQHAIPPVDSGTLDGQTLRWETDTGEWQATSDLVVDDSGNVGIGTDSPNRRLSVLTTNVVPATIGSTAASSSISFTTAGHTSETTAALGYDDATTSMVLKSPEDITFRTQFSSVAGQRMVIKKDGGVGIGTDSPSKNLEVSAGSGNIRISSTTAGSNSVLELYSTNTSSPVIRFGDPEDDDVGRIQYDHNNNYMRFFTNGTEKMRIDSSGNLLVGTTSSAGATGDSVVINGTAYLVGRATVGNAANVHIGGTGQLFESTSSLRFKENVQDYTRGLADVMGLRPVSFTNIGGGKTHAGLIAEEVHDAGLTEFVNYEEDEVTPRSIGYGNMVGLLAKAIQEQQQMIDELKAQVEGLINA